MHFLRTEHPEVVIIKPFVFNDYRGSFMESYNIDKFRAGGISVEFVQDNYVKSIKNTLRGLHFQTSHPQAKLLRCLKGKIFDVAVDIRKDSSFYGKWVGMELSEQNNDMLYIPEGFAHGYYVMSENAEVSYKCSNIYYPEFNESIIWNDPEIGIDWPCEIPILSEKDKKAPTLKEFSIS